MKTNGNLTRRGFLGASALALQGALLIPNSALADQADTGVTEIEGSAEARALWEEAVRRDFLRGRYGQCPNRPAD